VATGLRSLAVCKAPEQAFVDDNFSTLPMQETNKGLLLAVHLDNKLVSQLEQSNGAPSVATLDLTEGDRRISD
jgi:hypothetical protein